MVLFNMRNNLVLITISLIEFQIFLPTSFLFFFLMNHITFANFKMHKESILKNINVGVLFI